MEKNSNIIVTPGIIVDAVSAGFVEGSDAGRLDGVCDWATISNSRWILWSRASRSCFEAAAATCNFLDRFVGWMHIVGMNHMLYGKPPLRRDEDADSFEFKGR